MSVPLQHDLKQLQRHILDRAAFVETAVEKAIQSLQTQSVDLARQVLAGNCSKDQTDNYLEEECVRILALRQPVASDLRRIIVIMKINTDLDRIAELAVNIGERVFCLDGLPPVPPPSQLSQMLELTVQMVHQSLESFVSHDATMARNVIQLDDVVDHLNGEIISVLIQGMQAGAGHVPGGLSFFSAVRQLERIADYAAMIAEDVLYLVEGEMIHHKHSPARLDTMLMKN
ncbi:MAG: phosphate signaling complex protein PhoU [Schlesneria sp.]